jgi:hypothetical protein
MDKAQSLGRPAAVTSRSTFRHELALFLAAAGIMALTRYYPLSSVLGVPDASVAIFFLAGFAFRQSRYSGWVFGALFAAGWLIDYTAIAAGGTSDWCFTPAYAFLIPAYGCVWYAGRWCADRQGAGWRHWVSLSAVLLISVSLAFLISDAGFYLFSGRYPEASWQVYTARVAAYYPHYVAYAVAYVGLAVLLRLAAALRPDWQAPGLPRR